MIALGPCLSMGMAALALYIVRLRFSRTRHALLWAAGCTAASLQWGVMALSGMAIGHPLHTGLAASILGISSTLLLTEGFRSRARSGRTPIAMLTIAAAAIAALLLLSAVPVLPIRAALIPLLSMGLLIWMACLVPTAGMRPSATEIVTIAILLTVALIHAAGAAVAIGEQAGVVRSHIAYQSIYMLAVEPVSAALSMAIVMLIAYDFSVELRRLLHSDPLTGVLNRLGFDHHVRSAFDRARNRPMSIALADIDRFKQVNDIHGHSAGDAALRRVATHLMESLGRDGQVARIGGEEFALLLPGLDEAHALARVEALRVALASVRVDGQPLLRIAASFGLARRRPGETPDALLERADAALYQSKRNGRDRVTVATTDDPA